MPERCHFAHLTWLDALEVADTAWANTDDFREARCLTLLKEHLAFTGALTKVAAPTTRRRQAVAAVDDLPAEWQEVLDAAVQAAMTSARGRRMAVEVPLGLALASDSAASLERIKVLLEDRIQRDIELAGVKVWQWTSRTGGRAYTEAGDRMGRELRLTPPKT